MKILNKKPEVPEEAEQKEEVLSKVCSTITGYFVEARQPHGAFSFHKQIFTKEWSQVIAEDVLLIKDDPLVAKELMLHGYLDYPLAEAVRWAFHHQNKCEFGLETRIVAVEIKTDQTAIRKNEHELVGGEDRSSIIPDWNQ